MFSCFSPLLVPFFSCTWCAQAWQWPLFKVSTQVSSHFSPSHFLKHTSHFLSDFFLGYLAISLSHFLLDYLGLFGGGCRFCPRHTDRFFSGFLETCIFTRTAHHHQLPLWGRNAKGFVATTQQKPIRSGKCWSYIWISPFLQISCMCILHCALHRHALLCLAERQM